MSYYEARVSVRTVIEGFLLSAGLIACALLAFNWMAGSDHRSISGALLDSRLWASVLASLEIGIVAGGCMAMGILGLGGMFLYADSLPPRLVTALSLAIAMTPDLVHGLIWRSVAQPGLGLPAFQSLLGVPDLQVVVLGMVLALKWSPLLIVIAAASLDRRRAQLRRTLRLTGVSESASFIRTTASHIRRWALIGFAAGVLMGARQHELSETLVAGGVGLRAEGLSQWISTVAINFLDPGRAAADLLLILCLLMLAGGSLTGPDKLFGVRSNDG